MTSPPTVPMADTAQQVSCPLLSSWSPWSSQQGAPRSHCGPIHLRGNLFAVLALRRNVYGATDRIYVVRNQQGERQGGGKKTAWTWEGCGCPSQPCRFPPVCPQASGLPFSDISSPLLQLTSMMEDVGLSLGLAVCPQSTRWAFRSGMFSHLAK